MWGSWVGDGGSWVSDGRLWVGDGGLVMVVFGVLICRMLVMVVYGI